MSPAKYDLSNRTVAVLATDGFEKSELTKPLDALVKAGADAKVISLSSTSERIRGWAGGDWSDEVAVDGVVSNVSADDFDALVLPGGVMSPDTLRMDADAVDFVRGFFASGKPVAAICHGPWMIIEAEAAKGRQMTSYPSIRTDLQNAGARWVDEEVVVDQGLVTSRSPEDMDAFVDKMLEEIEEGIHRGQHA
ncbi:MAG: type 1 glutamine amidotransferase domain-containing protein [Gemmatimonadota bacterium]